MGLSKITRNWQITLPKDIRELKGLKEGDSIIFTIEGDRVDIIKATKDIIKSTAGLWTETRETGIEFERRLRRAWHKRVQRELR